MSKNILKGQARNKKSKTQSQAIIDHPRSRSNILHFLTLATSAIVTTTTVEGVNKMSIRHILRSIGAPLRRSSLVIVD